jgi:hypothetical protein
MDADTSTEVMHMAEEYMEQDETYMLTTAEGDGGWGSMVVDVGPYISPVVVTEKEHIRAK